MSSTQNQTSVKPIINGLLVTVNRKVLAKLQTNIRENLRNTRSIDSHVVGSVSILEVAIVDSFAVKKTHKLNADVDTEDSKFMQKCFGYILACT